MTELEWLTCKRSGRMLYQLGCGEFHDLSVALVTGRKLRLWCAALAVRAYGLDHAYDQGGYATWAEGEPEPDDPEDNATAPYRVAHSWAENGSHVTVGSGVRADLLREIVGNPFRRFLWCHLQSGCSTEDFDAVLSGFTHLDYRWRTETVLSLAKAAWDHLSPAGELDAIRLAVLADALEEAGCQGKLCQACGPPLGKHDPLVPDYLPLYHCGECDPFTHRFQHPLLAHLRASGPHVRGCWALDVILLS
jgi:hypothetical protein